MQQGAIAFLDILGWKDIWRRKNFTTDQIINIVRSSLDIEERIVKHDGKYFIDYNNIKIKSISDTVVIYIHDSNAKKALTILAHRSASILTTFLRKNLPMRGAISYGDFDEQDFIMIGPAITEVASWYELADWIGIILTPSAEYSYELCKEINYDDSLIIKDYLVPIKNSSKIPLKSINWPHYWIERNGLNAEKELKQMFLNMGPITIDIANKIKNTEIYYKEMENMSPLSKVFKKTEKQLPLLP